MSLAPKLPYDHPFAGGYPRIGGQPLPTDPDAIDYLARVAAADGAGVEVGVAMAVDAFVRGCKADGIWDALKASCILCGARTISGALVPLAGTAPTAYSFASGDYSRTTGLVGDGATKYLDSNRANDADGPESHIAVYSSSVSAASGRYLAGYSDAGSNFRLYYLSGQLRAYVYSSSFATRTYYNTPTFVGTSRSGDVVTARSLGSQGFLSQAAVAFSGQGNVHVFANNFGTATSGYSDARLSFYSIGPALDLAALDNRVSTLVAAIAAAL